MRFYIFAIAILLAGAFGVSAQTVTDCPHPSGCLVISRDAGLKHLALDDENKALKSENTVLKTAIDDQKKITGDVKVEYARAMGRVTELEKSALENRALVELAIKRIGKKCGVLSVLCL